MFTQEALQELLHYNPETGAFTWRVQSNGRVPVGTIAGSIHVTGYRQIKIGRKFFKAHRLAWFYVHGHWPHGDLDHINRIKDDNRIVNLRLASRGQNMSNARVYKNNKLRIKGVHEAHKGSYTARISHKGTTFYLGTYPSIEAACAVLTAKRQELHAEFAFNG